jgi:tetratricopeptide (TPR) repeat protein
MVYRLLLVDGQGKAACTPLGIRLLREFPGPDSLSVHFRPVRNDLLFESARTAGQLAYRILRGEGIVRAQLTVEYEVAESLQSVRGRSSDLLFALALITGKWKLAALKDTLIAATGILGADGSVLSVEHTAAKLAAAVADLADGARAIIFYPAADAEAVAQSRPGDRLPAHIELIPVEHLDDALRYLGYALDKVYLRNPFRGLEHFDYADHAIFFGRDAEVREVVQLLLRRERGGAPGLLVEGASGSGKSSFLRAGVLPALVEPRFQSEEVQEALRRQRISAGVGRAIWRPGLLGSGAAVGEAQFAESIAEVWSGFPELGGAWRESRFSTLAELAAERRKCWPPEMRFVWLIDQFEELLVRGLPEAMIESFGRFLVGLQTEGVWTLASIRADAMPLLKRYEALREVFGANEGQRYLATLGGTALDAVIMRPARAADLTFEIGEDGKPLDQTLREDAYREKDGLPMLQFTLNELYQKRSGNMLTVAAYRALGGLSGSIATTAERILSGQGEDSERAAQRLFRSLVSVDDLGNATRRYARLSELSGDPAQFDLLQRFIAARLCVADQRGGEAVVAFAHDTLLQTLPALTAWLQRETGLMQTRDLAQRETQSWQQHGMSDDWLAAADKLAAFERLEVAGVVLPDSVGDFIARSRRRVRRTRRIRRIAIGAIAVLAVGVVVGAVAFGLQARKAEVAREMTARRGEFLEGLLKSADPRGGKRDITVAQLLDASTKEIEPLTRSEPLVAASMLSLVAETDEGLGRYAEGLAANDRALALLRSQGGGAAELSAALSTRGELLMMSGRDHDAETALQEAIAVVEHQAGAEKPLAVALDDLGAAYQDSREKEAEALYKRSIAVYQRGGARLAASASAVDPIANLGVLYLNEGRYTEATEYMKRAVDLLRKLLPHDHPDLLTAEYNYAGALEENGQAPAAEPILRELVESYTRVAGPDHISTLLAQQGVAHNLLRQQRYQEAMAMALPAAQRMSTVAGEDHVYSQTGWDVYGAAACQSGHGEEGLKALRRVATLQRSGTDDVDWRRQVTDEQIGKCLVGLHRYDEAEPLLLAAVSALEAARGAGYSSTQDGYRALRDLYAGWGRPQESAKWQGKLLPAAR